MSALICPLCSVRIEPLKGYQGYEFVSCELCASRRAARAWKALAKNLFAEVAEENRRLRKEAGSE